MTPRLLETDVLVIGSGVAGLSAALAAQKSGRRVLIVCKGPFAGRSCSWYSGGQLSLHLPGEHDGGEWLADSPLTDKAVAHALAAEAPRQIRSLARHGLNVRGSKSGGFRIDNSEAGHAFSGISLITQMTRSAAQAGVKLLSGFTTAQLLVSDGRCLGAVGFTHEGEFVALAAKAVVLASGGACWMFQHSTNPRGITGDGYAMLLHAGAELANVEFVRFFPLGLPGFRFSSHRPFRRFYDIDGLRAVNGDGEDIFQKHLGLSLYEAMESTYSRFVTMSAIVTQERRESEVLLDFGKLPAKTWKRLQSLGPEGLVKNYGGSREMWTSILKHRSASAAPIAQTFVGGAKVTADMATSMAGLFACGEVASFHFDLSAVPRCEIGPLPCALTSGGIAGKEAGRAAGRARKTASPAGLARSEIKRLRSMLERKQGHAPKPLSGRIRQIMSRHCGPARSEISLREGLGKLDRLEPRLARLKAAGAEALSQAVEAQSMALVARATLSACLMREESRSEHYREDFPAKNTRWQQNIIVGLDQNDILSLRTIPTGNP